MLFIVKNNIYHTKYNIKTSNIEGYITKIKIDGNKVTIILKAKEKILVNYYLTSKQQIDIFKNYQLGDKIKVKGTFNVPPQNSNFNLFNYRHYLFSNNIHWIVNASNIIMVKRNKNIGYKIKNDIINRIEKIDNSYMSAFILGDSSEIDNQTMESYRSNGISHLFALSGMHVSLITLLLIFIIKRFTKNKIIIGIIIFPLLIFYMFLASFTPSICRACIMFIILFINNKRFKTLNIYIILTCIVVLKTPYLIYNVAFLFSYTITLYLILFSKFINRFKNYFLKLLIVSMISFIASIPIMIMNFHSVNIIGFVYNLFYIPFVSFFILPLIFLTF